MWCVTRFGCSRCLRCKGAAVVLAKAPRCLSSVFLPGKMGATILALRNSHVFHGTEWDKSCLHPQQSAAISVPRWEKVNPQMGSEARGTELLSGCTVQFRREIPL